MTYTPEQLRKWADWYEDACPTDGPIPQLAYTLRIEEELRAHAAALEEIERLNAAWKAQQFHLEGEERESEHWQQRAEKSESERDALKRHAEAMADAIQFGDLAILTVAKAAAESYRASFPKAIQ